MSPESIRSASLSTFGDGYGLDRDAIEAFQNDYLPSAVDRRSACVSPLCAEDLRGVAPAHVLTAELDPLRDSGEAFARRLIEAGVRTTVHRHLGQTHGSAVLWPTWGPAAVWMAEVVQALRGALCNREDEE
jgi:acetyl esterase